MMEEQLPSEAGSDAQQPATNANLAGSSSKQAQSNAVTSAVNIGIRKDDILLEILTYLDVPALVQKKQVSVQWKRIGTKAIDQKCGGTPRPFGLQLELRSLVHQYIKSSEQPEYAEAIASTYGWPIGKWDVSHLEDFSYTFHNCDTFNEDISRWDTSNAYYMNYTFFGATRFNQPICDWNISNVEETIHMFTGAVSYTHLTLPTTPYV